MGCLTLPDFVPESGFVSNPKLLPLFDTLIPPQSTHTTTLLYTGARVPLYPLVEEFKGDSHDILLEVKQIKQVGPRVDGVPKGLNAFVSNAT